MGHRIVVAIDGPAGAGKSTVARVLASRLGFVYIDTGAMYRAVALWAMRAGVAADDAHKVEELARQADIRFESGTDRVLLNGEDVTAAIRESEVSVFASRISAIGGVRRELRTKQRELAADNSAIMEGRDIGTVVFPEARVKIFLDAPTPVRAQRRAGELLSRGAAVSQEQTALEIAERDHRDRTRVEAPLMQAPDAIYIDSEGMPVEDVVEAILKIVRDRTANGREYVR